MWKSGTTATIALRVLYGRHLRRPTAVCVSALIDWHCLWWDSLAEKALKVLRPNRTIFLCATDVSHCWHRKWCQAMWSHTQPSAHFIVPFIDDNHYFYDNPYSGNSLTIRVTNTSTIGLNLISNWIRVIPTLWLTLRSTLILPKSLWWSPEDHGIQPYIQVFEMMIVFRMGLKSQVWSEFTAPEDLTLSATII